MHEVLPFLSTNKENVVNVALLLFFVVKCIFVRLIFTVVIFFGFFFKIFLKRLKIIFVGQNDL